MKSKRIGLILAFPAVALLIGTLVAALWPVKTEYSTSCGSLLAASSSVYNDAYQRRMGERDASRRGETQQQRGLRVGLDMIAGRDPNSDADVRSQANSEVAACADKRQTGGIVAGALLLLAVGAGGMGGYLITRGRSGTATT